ncbi:hypothetical protein I4F81_011468 [Pyropia yezoensis]|uniref:Uncharacterized protein n=1 Tax=Pyropia yezoensis TaxID=2788 RepID=A0ACC3CGU8_PYRYE|nr:hypothetical protein I4F81_011468 [Neopyropia yezoensis]|eukprot:contig_24328_g5999
MDGGRAAEQGDPPRDGEPPAGGSGGGGCGGPGDVRVATGSPGANKKDAGSSTGGGDGNGVTAAPTVVVAPDNVPEASGRPLKRQKADPAPTEASAPNGAAGEGTSSAASPAGTTGATTPPAAATANAGGKPTAGVDAPTRADPPVIIPAGDCPAGEAVWASLLASNATFAAEGNRPPVEGVSVAHREALAAGQSPAAVVVTCSDSRVSPELLFARGLGELFVVRTAGNTAAFDLTVASVEFGVHNLGSPLVVVLGHTKCGAVAAAVATAADADAMAGQPPGLAAFVKAALVAPVRAVKERGGVAEADFVSACEVENVAAAVRSLVTTSAWMGKAQAGGKVKVVGALYNVAAGTVSEV